MSTPLDDLLANYVTQPVGGDRIPVTVSLSASQIDLLRQLADERGVAFDALVEFLLFKQLKVEHARRLVDEPPERLPKSFTDDRVARAKVDLAKDVAAVKAGIEERGDRATRIAEQMQAALDQITGDTDSQLEEVQRQSALSDAMIDEALKKKR